jgi:hypothetical protein
LISNPETLAAFEAIKKIQRDTVLELNETLRDKILLLWNDPVIVRTIARRNEYQVSLLPSPFVLIFALSPLPSVHLWSLLVHSAAGCHCSSRLCALCGGYSLVASEDHRNQRRVLRDQEQRVPHHRCRRTKEREAQMDPLVRPLLMSPLISSALPSSPPLASASIMSPRSSSWSLSANSTKLSLRSPKSIGCRPFPALPHRRSITLSLSLPLCDQNDGLSESLCLHLSQPSPKGYPCHPLPQQGLVSLSLSSLHSSSQCDLFREKVVRVSLGSVSHWSDYCGAPHSYEEGVDYFLNKFLSSNKDRTRDVYYHVTCATDTGNIRFVLDACTEILLRDDLDKLGIIA